MEEGRYGRNRKDCLSAVSTRAEREELQDLFTPARAEIDFARSLVRSNQHFFAAVLRLKCLQYLGYFPEFYEIPTTVVNHVRIRLRLSAQEMPAFDPMRTSDSDSRPLQLKPAYSREARKVAVRKVFEAAQVMVNWNSA